MARTKRINVVLTDATNQALDRIETHIRVPVARAALCTRLLEEALTRYADEIVPRSPAEDSSEEFGL